MTDRLITVRTHVLGMLTSSVAHLQGSADREAEAATDLPIEAGHHDQR